jgi:hypothetical protein
LLVRVGSFDLTAPDHALAFGLGFVLFGLMMARRFGRFNGGNLAKDAPQE